MQNENLKTTTYKFAFVVEGDVGMSLTLGQNQDLVKQVACMRSNPEIIEVEPNHGDLAKFNFVNNGIVNWTIDFNDSPSFYGFIACLRSHPKIIEVPSTHPVRSGWTYDGINFYEPNISDFS